GVLALESPVVGDVDPIAALEEGPYAPAFEIAPGFEREARRPMRLCAPHAPAHRVWQPAASVKLVYLRLDLLHVEIERPPAHQVERLVQNVVDLVSRGLHSLASDEMILV